MARFVQILQLAVLIIVGFFLVKDFILSGIGIFEQLWVIIAVGLTLVLELALWVIFKLIEDD